MSASNFSYKNLEFAAKHHKNVMLSGDHGVGKTAMIKEVFEKYFPGAWKYFSASTMDPYTDLIGCPKERIDEHGTAILDMVRPADFAYDKVEAIFLDEYNRSTKATRNATMEMIQFKTIHGKPLSNLKVVWTAINPPNDGEYNVEEVDPAQKDRFHMFMNVPYKPDIKFFVKKFGKEVAEGALAWWNELPKEKQKIVSPRRLEYALDFFLLDGDLNSVLDGSLNIKKLRENIKQGPTLEKYLKLKTDKQREEFLSDENAFAAMKEYLCNAKNFNQLQYVPIEKLCSLICNDNMVLTHVITETDSVKKFKEAIVSIHEAGTDKKISELAISAEIVDVKEKK